MKKLHRIFALEGCRKADEKHRIPVLIEKAQWTAVQSHRHGSDDTGLPLLHLPQNGEKLTYLHGRHRLAAAYCVLPERDRWWGVDFYDSNSRAVPHLLSPA